MKSPSRATPADLARSWRVRQLQVRRVLRSLFGTLERQDRGPRWYLTQAEVAQAIEGETAWVVLRGHVPPPL